MAVEWTSVRDYNDIIFEKAYGMGKITINRPEVHNAFRPETLTELIDAFTLCREDPEIGVVIFTGKGIKLSALAVISVYEGKVAMWATMAFLA